MVTARMFDDRVPDRAVDGQHGAIIAGGDRPVATARSPSKPRHALATGEAGSLGER